MYGYFQTDKYSICIKYEINILNILWCICITKFKTNIVKYNWALSLIIEFLFLTLKIILGNPTIFAEIQ